LKKRLKLTRPGILPAAAYYPSEVGGAGAESFEAKRKGASEQNKEHQKVK